MSKLFWVRLAKWDMPLAQCALEQGADALVLPAGCVAEVQKLGLIQTIATDGDKILGKDILDIIITDKIAEQKAAAAGVPVIIKNTDWTIIPLENLIAAKATVIQTVTNTTEAELALTILEIGAAGVCLEPKTPQDIIDVAEVVRATNNENLKLEVVTIDSVLPAGMADRVCIDTTSILPKGSGSLIGDSSAAMFLVHNENVQNEYVNARPFRVNAGAVHAYVKLPSGKTNYLSELKAGGNVLIVDHTGKTFPAIVGRAKIEKRPMLLVKARSAEGKNVSLILQNAETIRLVTPEGGWISVTTLKSGDKVLAYFEEAGRHFGMKVKETITEK